MADDLYIKDRLSERKTKRFYKFPLILALVLIVIATVLALVVNRPANQEAGEDAAKSQDESRIETAEGQSAGQAAKSETESAPPPRELVQMLRKGRELAEEGSLLEARNTLLKVLKLADNEVVREKSRKLLNEINPKLLLSQHPMPSKEKYVVKSGDTLQKIARQYDTNIALLRKVNQISGDIIHPGQRLLIPTGDFSILVDKSDNVLTVHYNRKYFKNYRVGTGKYEKTPTAETKVTDRIAQPTWWKPDGKAIPYGSPENLLGTHWLSLDIPGYGIHGTWEPKTIGKHESAGCIRMLNENIEELYTMIPIGTPVEIKD